MQGEPPCFGSADERECTIALLGLSQFLTMADNGVANFVDRRIVYLCLSLKSSHWVVERHASLLWMKMSVQIRKVLC